MRARLMTIFKNTDSPVPWLLMANSGLATFVPLFVGWWRGEVLFSLYGALMGYLISLNDHNGTTKSRVLVTVVSYVCLAASFALGISLHGHFWLFFALTSLVTYTVGLFGGYGAEVERLLLFCSIKLVIAYYATTVPETAILPANAYGLLALAMVLLGILISAFFPRNEATEFASLADSAKSLITVSRKRHIYALSYWFAFASAIYLSECFHIERGYWTVITVLLVMKFDRLESLNRHVQRVAGTLCGVLVGELIITMNLSPLALIFGVAAAASLVPYGLKRNYWLVSFFVSILTLQLLALAYQGSARLHLPVLRLLATIYGCGLSATILALSAGIEYLLKRQVQA